MKNNRMNMVESFKTCYDKATSVQKNSIKAIVKITNESLIVDCILRSVSRIPTNKYLTFSMLLTEVTSSIASEVLYYTIINSLTDIDIEDFEARIQKHNIYINSRRNCRNNESRNNLVPIIMKMDAASIPSKNLYRKMFGAKNKALLLKNTKKTVGEIRPFIVAIIEDYNSKVQVFERHTEIKNNKQVFKIIGIKPLNHTENYMLSTPGTIGDMKCKLGGNTPTERSLMTQSIETVLNMPFTFDEDFNTMIEAIVDEPVFRELLAGKSTDEDAINAKVAQAQLDVSEGLGYWRDLGMGNVYFKYVIDFRGRISQLGGLSAVGNKVGKNMVRSGHAHELGEHGHDEILIALAGAVGYDKETFDVRLAWAKENVDKYETIGRTLLENPCGGFDLLRDCDDPFAAATLSLELTRIADFEGDVSKYCSNIFIGYDATSSAVQLVGLMMGNERLTEASNVRVGADTEDKIHDSYMLLSDIMDSAATKVEQTETIKMWLSFNQKTKRAFAKPLLMTRLYGSAFLTHMDSAREVAIGKGLIDANDNQKLREFGKGIAQLFNYAFNNEEGFNCLRSYEQYLKAISAAYSSKGMDTEWSIQDTSTFNNQKVISTYVKLEGERYYAYFDGKKHEMRTYGLDILSEETNNLVYKENVIINKTKSKSASTPNFTHGHDAIVLHSTVVKLNKPMRLTHDCMATTPGMSYKMRGCINETYVELFGDNKLNQIEALQEECFKNTGILVDLPEFFNREGIKSSEIAAAKYKFS